MNATCSNAPSGSWTCTCNTGYRGNGINCMPAVLGDWEVDAFIKASNAETNDQFGTEVALSHDGNTLAVSAYTEDSSVTGINGTPDNLAADSGAVYVYTRSANGIWSQQAFIKASNTGADDTFGISIALSGDGNLLAVGAAAEDSSTTGVNGLPNESAMDSGAVYVFARTGGTWSQQAYIKASNAGGGDRFGYDVALSSDGATLAVGAYNEDSLGAVPNENATNSGAVYVFTRAGSAWSQQAFVKAGNAGAEDQFGSVVALSSNGSVLAVGAPAEDSSTSGIDGTPNESAAESGAAYIFVRTNGLWTQQAFVKAGNTGAGDTFGTTLALSADGSLLAVGAPDEDSSVSGVNGTPNDSLRNSGAVYLFERVTNSWSQRAFVKPHNPGYEDNFGYVVSLSADARDLVVGATGEDSSVAGINQTPNDGLASSGAVYVFQTMNWSLRTFVKATNPGQLDFFGSAVCLSGDGRSLVVAAFMEASSVTGVGGTPNDNATGSGAVYTYFRDYE